MQEGVQLKPVKTNSLVFYVDELSCRLVAEEFSDGERLGGVLDLSLEDLKLRDPAEVRNSIGRLVLAFLNSRSKSGLGLPRDVEDNQRLDEEYDKWENEQLQLMEAKSAAGDAASKRVLAMSMITKALRTKSTATLLRGEQLLREAVSAGDVEAAEYMKDLWPSLKARCDSTFE